MRKLTTSLAMIAALGWAFAAQAGTINSTWDLSGSDGKTTDTTSDPDRTVPADSIMGTMCLTFSNAASTKSSLPHSQSTVTMGCFTSTATGTYAGVLGATLKAKLKTAITGLHLSSNDQFGGSASGKFQFTSIGHCAFFCGLVPGDWNASVTKTQMFTKTLHLPAQNFYTHVAGSTTGKFLGSGTITIIPGQSSNGHLISSNNGYHTMHLRATMKSSQ